LLLLKYKIVPFCFKKKALRYAGLSSIVNMRYAVIEASSADGIEIIGFGSSPLNVIV
jgi:hypothetical protein